MTSYGCVSRSDYLNQFRKYLMNKYNLSNYSQYQSWAQTNAELIGKEYSGFQHRTGLKSMLRISEDEDDDEAGDDDSDDDGDGG